VRTSASAPFRKLAPNWQLLTFIIQPSLTLSLCADSLKSLKLKAQLEFSSSWIQVGPRHPQQHVSPGFRGQDHPPLRGQVLQDGRPPEAQDLQVQGKDWTGEIAAV